MQAPITVKRRLLYAPEDVLLKLLTAEEGFLRDPVNFFFGLNFPIMC